MHRSIERIEEHILRFTSYFQKQTELIASLEGNPRLIDIQPKEFGLALHKKMLLSAILDSIARIRYSGQKLSNTERFVGIVKEHGDWPEGHLVSTKILRDRLIEKGCSSSPLLTRLDENIAKVRHLCGTNFPISQIDEPIASLEKIANVGEELKCVNSSQHFQLFYKYRNFLVHEYREPGYGWESLTDNDHDPIYQSMPSGLGRGEPIRLVYPVMFFHRVACSVIDSFKAWASKNNIDPYDRVTDGSAWTE